MLFVSSGCPLQASYFFQLNDILSAGPHSILTDADRTRRIRRKSCNCAADVHFVNSQNAVLVVSVNIEHLTPRGNATRQAGSTAHSTAMEVEAERHFLGRDSAKPHNR